MRHLSSLAALLVAGSALTACSDAPQPAPTQPPAPGVRNSLTAPTSTEITNQIKLIFPAGGLQNAALAQFANVAKSVSQGKTTATQAQAGALINLVLRELNAGHLVAPAGGLSAFDDPSNLSQKVPATTAQEGAVQLVSAISLFAGLGSGGTTNVDAAAVFVPVNATSDIVVKTGTGLAAVRIPPGALGVDALVTITPIPYQGFPVGSGPLATTTGQAQYPYFYEFQTFPNIPQFAAEVRAQVCQLENGPYDPPEAAHPRLHLAHNVTTVVNGSPTVNAQLLPRVTGIDLICVPQIPTTTTGSLYGPGMGGMLARASAATRGLASTISDWLTPVSAYAAHGGLGGLTTSFSPFGAVDAGANAILLTPTNVAQGSGVNFSAVDASGASLPLTCVPNPPTPSSNTTVGGFDGSTFYGFSPGTTLVTMACSNLTTNDTPVVQIVQQVVSVYGPRSIIF